MRGTLLSVVSSFLLAAGSLAPAARAVSCTTASAMQGVERSALFDAAHQVGGDVLRGDVAALKARTIPSLASNFSGIADAVSGLAPTLAGATLTVTNLYSLNADDLAGSEDDVQFFCSVPGAPLLVTVTLSELPKGRYALAVVHATGVKAPQQFALILQNTAPGAPANWQLAGFFARPLTMDGHDSDWFWSQARTLKTKGQLWSAFFFDQTASYLARPADLYTSNNLEKLSRETASVEPRDLPGNHPMMVSTEGQSFAVTGLRADASLGSLDLRIDARVDSVADPVLARKDALTLMAALLHEHPELRDNFHGLWVYESTPGGKTFAVEQPVTALP